MDPFSDRRLFRGMKKWSPNRDTDKTDLIWLCVNSVQRTQVVDVKLDIRQVMDLWPKVL